jgi:hypothetical protein
MKTIQAQYLPLKYTRNLGFLCFGVLFFLSVVFYLERIATLDMSFQCFHILRTGELQIQSGRFGAGATQFFPWAAQCLGWSLNSVLMSYSIGHVLYTFTIFLLLIFWLQQWKWALVLLLLNTLMTTHTFYWLSEMHQGLSFLVLLLAWVDAKKTIAKIHIWQWPFYISACITAFYFHPMILYAALFAVGYMWTGQDEDKERRSFMAITAVLFVAITIIKYKVLKLDWYDAMSLERAQVFAQTWPHWIDIQSNRDFIRWCLSDYYLLPLVIGLNVVALIRQQAFWRAAWALACPLGYLLLVNIPFHTGDKQFYLENLYLPLAFMASVPFVFSVVQPRNAFKSTWLFIGFLLLIRLLHIGFSHQHWSDRLAWEQGFLQKTTGHLLVSEKDVPMDLLLFSWGSATEFLMLSALNNPDSARCILIDQQPERFDSLRMKPGLFLGAFRNYPFSELPATYYRPQTSLPYTYYKP